MTSLDAHVDLRLAERLIPSSTHASTPNSIQSDRTAPNEMLVNQFRSGDKILHSVERSDYSRALNKYGRNSHIGILVPLSTLGSGVATDVQLQRFLKYSGVTTANDKLLSIHVLRSNAAEGAQKNPTTAVAFQPRKTISASDIDAMLEGRIALLRELTRPVAETHRFLLRKSLFGRYPESKSVESSFLKSGWHTRFARPAGADRSMPVERYTRAWRHGDGGPDRVYAEFPSEGRLSELALHLALDDRNGADLTYYRGELERIFGKAG